MRPPAVSDARPGRRFDARVLPVIVGAAVVARLAAVAAFGTTVTELPGIADQRSYHDLALRVAGGHGFSFAEGHWPATPAGEPTAHWSFLYTLYLATLYALLGVAPLAARLLQAVLVGVLHPWLAWRVGHRLFGERAGLFAAALAAGYGYFIYYAGALVTEAFYFVAILWTLDAATRQATRRKDGGVAKGWIELGLAIGITALLRQVFLVFAPVLAAWLVVILAGPPTRWTWRRVRSPLRGVVIAATLACLLIAPWTIRNYRAFGAFVPLNTNAGFALYWGNHPVHGTTFVPIFDGAFYGTLIPGELRDLNEAALDRVLLQRALDGIAADPGRFFRLSLSRVREYFRFWPSSNSSLIANLVRVLSFGLCLPLMVYGIALVATERRRREDLRGTAGASLLALFVLVYTGIHVASWTLIRYRLPVDAVLLIFAARALDQIAGIAQSSSSGRIVNATTEM